MARKITRSVELNGYYKRGRLNRAIDKVIIVIGTGGTGGYVIPHLARFISLINKKRRGGMGSGRPDDIRMVIVDGDEVEEKNLVRQNFVRRDIGRYKAEVLAERYSHAFGVRIGYYKGFLEDTDSIDRLIKSQAPNAKPIVITCVDNNKTRKLIWEWYESRPKIKETFWIDSGNETDHGQVVIGYKTGIVPSKEIAKDDVKKFRLPCVFEMFPNSFGELGMLPSEERNREDCAAQAVENPQTIFINMMAAQTILNVMQAILQHDPIDYHAVYFRTTNNQSRPVRITEDSIDSIGSMITNFHQNLKDLELFQVAYPNAKVEPEGELELAVE